MGFLPLAAAIPLLNLPCKASSSTGCSRRHGRGKEVVMIVEVARMHCGDERVRMSSESE